MKVEFGIRPNCSEWDEIIEPEDSWISEDVERILKQARREASLQAIAKDWDK